MSKSRAKQMAKGTKPRMARISSSKVLGTSSETTNKVRAKPKTTSLKASSREGIVPRIRNAYFGFCIVLVSATDLRAQSQHRSWRRGTSQSLECTTRVPTQQLCRELQRERRAPQPRFAGSPEAFRPRRDGSKR